MKTRKVGKAGKFGVRYGKTMRERYLAAVPAKPRQQCPQCGKLRLVRLSAGIWQCRKCNVKFAGRAYKPE